MNRIWRTSQSATLAVLLLCTSGPSSAQDLINTGMALVNLLQTANSFYSPVPTGPDPTLEAVLQNRQAIRELHDRMHTVESGLLLAVEKIGNVHEQLKLELIRQSEQEQRSRVRGIMESIQIYVTGLERQSSGGEWIITDPDRASLKRYHEHLSIASATLAQGHDINAPVLVGALGMEVGLLNALGLERQIENTKEAYRERLVKLFDPQRSSRSSGAIPSLREEMETIARPLISEFEYVSWNQASNTEARLTTLLHGYESGDINCKQAQKQATLLRSLALRPLWDMGIDTSSSPGDSLSSSCRHPLLKLHHDLLAHVKGVVERLGPTQEGEERWLTADWPCSLEWARRLESILMETMDTNYTKWSSNIAALGCTR